ncbi:MAG: ATP-binding protein [bacterium]
MGARLPLTGYRFRVYLFAALMVLLVLMSVGITMGVAWYSKQTASMIVEKDFKSRQIENTVVDLLLSMDRNRRKFLLLKKPEYRDRFLEEAADVRKSLGLLETIGLSEEEKRYAAQLRTSFEEALDADPLGLQQETNFYEAFFDLPMKEIYQLLRLNQESIDVRISEMNRLEGHSIRVGLIMASLSLLMAIVLSVFLIRSVTMPIRLLRRSTQEIADGRFDHRISLNSRDELGDLAGAFNEMAEQLKRLDDMKSDFIAIVSHELKTPLTSMKEAVELLREEAVGPVNAKQAHLLKINSQGIQKLAHFIDDILSLTRMEGGMLDLFWTWIDFQHLLDERLVPFRLLAEKKQLHLSASYDPQPLPLVYGDVERLKQVVDNLLDNAIRFTPNGGRVSVHVKYRRKGLPYHKAREEPVRDGPGRGSGLVVRVSDTGEGIPPAERKRVFDKFYQIRRRSSRGSGSGLGLSITRHIVEAHGGWIWAEDTNPRGTTFVFTLPQEEAEEAPQEETVETPVPHVDRVSQPVRA